MPIFSVSSRVARQSSCAYMYSAYCCDARFVEFPTVSLYWKPEFRSPPPKPPVYLLLRFKERYLVEAVQVIKVQELCAELEVMVAVRPRQIVVQLHVRIYRRRVTRI